MKLSLDNQQMIEIEAGKNGKDVLAFLPPLNLKPLAYALDDQLFDLLRPIPHDGHFRFIVETDKEAMDLLRHSTSHLLAEAIMHLYPGVQFGFGPSIEDGFYYDIDFKDVAISEDDFAKIELEMKKIAKANEKISRREVSKEEALELFKDNPYKIELIRDIQTQISVYQQGDFLDLCSGPHLPSTSYIKHFKLLSLAGAYWRGDSKNKTTGSHLRNFFLS